MPTIRRQSIFEVIQGHYAAELLLHLRRTGVLEALVKSQTTATLARRARIASTDLQRILQFLAVTTDAIASDDRGRYSLTNNRYTDLTFQLEKFVGAYGSCVRTIGGRPSEKAMVAAFTEGAKGSLSPAFNVIRDSGVRCLVDMGCGSASLLVQLAKVDSEFRGFGVDANKLMCRAARGHVRRSNLSSRIKIHHADARDIGPTLSRHLDSIDGVHGSSFLNEFFGSDGDAVSVLKRLRSLLPGRLAFFVDYYGELGHRPSSASLHPATVLQDLAQVVSGQGVPPPDSRAWRLLYRRAGCRVIRLMDFETSEIRWFIHQVEL